MARDRVQQSIINVLAVFALSFVWFNILGVLVQALAGEVKAGLALILAMFTFHFLGFKFKEVFST